MLVCLCCWGAPRQCGGLACWHAGRLLASEYQELTKNAVMCVLFACHIALTDNRAPIDQPDGWPSNSMRMPACQQCWGTPQQHRQISILGPPPWLAGHRLACQHASMLTTGGAGMLGCTPAAQTDQHPCPPSLADY